MTKTALAPFSSEAGLGHLGRGFKVVMRHVHGMQTSVTLNLFVDRGLLACDLVPRHSRGKKRSKVKTITFVVYNEESLALFVSTISLKIKMVCYFPFL